MEKYCKNCGTGLNENDEFCPDCGTRIDKNTIACENCGQRIHKDVRFCPSCGHPTMEVNKFCPNCGTPVEPAQEFCGECGTSMNSPVKAKASFTEEHRDKFIIAGIAAALVIALLVVASFMIAPQDIEPQRVEVGSTDFLIPGDYDIDPSTIDVDYQYASAIFAKGWVNDNGDLIYIATMTVPYGVDAQDVLSSQGGSHETIMGYDGYYTEEDGTYNFAFEDGGYICVVSTSSLEILDEITCLG